MSNPGAFAPTVDEAFAMKHKKDDLADSLLLVVYYLDTYSNQLTSLDTELLFNLLNGIEG